nr:hypothetical protein CFP56_11883 [Quercus suber]
MRHLDGKPMSDDVTRFRHRPAFPKEHRSTLPPFSLPHSPPRPLVCEKRWPSFCGPAKRLVLRDHRTVIPPS